MLKVRTLVKKVIFPVLHSSGIARRSWGRPDVAPLILFAHRVGSLSVMGRVGDFFRDIQTQVIDTKEFVRRLSVVQKFCNFVTFEEAIAGVVSPGKKRKTVMTFDDCYSDFLEAAQPVLERMGIPALYYVTTSPLRQRELLWYDKVYSSVIGTELPSVRIEGLEDRTFSLRTVKDRRVAAVEICRLLWDLRVPERDEIIMDLTGRADAGPLDPKKLYLSADALSELARRKGVAVGSHTVSHPNLMQLTNEEVESELNESKAVLESLTGRPVKHLSYPNGLADDRIWKIAERCGYETACMTKNGSASNIFGLRRVNIGWGTFSEFSVRMSGLLPW